MQSCHLKFLKLSHQNTNNDDNEFYLKDLKYEIINVFSIE